VDRVTSHDVARRAGVSRTTVSMVLNRSNAVTLSAETRARVLEAAAALGYRPNSAARMLVRGNTETIGLVMSDPSILPVDGFVPQLLHGVRHVNARHGFHVLLEGLDPESGHATYESLVEARRIDGLIVLNPRATDTDLQALVDRDFPVVLVGTIRHPNECSVSFSTRAGHEAAVDHLVAMGHRRVGAVPFSPSGYIAAQVRLSSLGKALASRGIRLDDDAVVHAGFSPESGHRAARVLLERRPDLTAIFAGNDTIAIGVISAAEALGRSVPGDLSVVGFDDLPFAAWLAPSLTTVRVDAVRQGAEAAELLIKRLKGERLESRQVRIETTFQIRNSTAPPRIARLPVPVVAVAAGP
jgi:DNA-binding LacI/PurR family transcriptional regulator